MTWLIFGILQDAQSVLGLGGGALGILGHLSGKVAAYLTEKAKLASSQKVALLHGAGDVREEEVKAEEAEDIKIGKVKPDTVESRWLVRAAIARRLFHPAITFLLVLYAGVLIFIPVPDDRAWIEHNVIGWAGLSMGWLLASVQADKEVLS